MPLMAPRRCDRHHKMSLLAPDVVNPKPVSPDGALGCGGSRLPRRGCRDLGFPKPAMEKGRPTGGAAIVVPRPGGTTVKASFSDVLDPHGGKDPAHGCRRPRR